VPQGGASAAQQTTPVASGQGTHVQSPASNVGASQAGQMEAQRTDFAHLQRRVMHSRPSNEGGISRVIPNSDHGGLRFIVHEVTTQLELHCTVISMLYDFNLDKFFTPHDRRSLMNTTNKNLHFTSNNIISQTDTSMMLVMRDIIEGYLNDKYGDEIAVDMLSQIDKDDVHSYASPSMLLDCYYAIKHLTAIGFETTIDELKYFRDCLCGKREYNSAEKEALLYERGSVVDNTPIIAMKIIINDYLDSKYDRASAVYNLMTFVDFHAIDSAKDPMIADCYYTIKHLTEEGYETTDFEIAYFRDCLNNISVYCPEEKFNLTQEYLRVVYNPPQ